MRTHKDLEIWKMSIELVKHVYAVTHVFPTQEQFGLVSQTRRASVSVPSNIAEGAARNSHKEFIHFCYIALGSLSEVETLIIIANELDYLKEDKYNTVQNEVELIRRKLLNFIKYVKGKQQR